MAKFKNRFDARNDDGAVAIIVAVSLVAFIGFAAFVVDAGYGYAVDRQHSVTADASALAGAQAAGLEYKVLYPGDGPGCTSATASAVEDEADTAAQETYDSNNVDGTSVPVVTNVTCEGSNFLVTVTTSSEVNAVFGPVLGVDTLHPGATATAIVSGSPAYGGLRPYAVCVDEFPDTGPVKDETYQSVFPQSPTHTVSCGTTSGQWGLMDFDGGSNPTGDTEAWTLSGYPGVVTFPTDIHGDPGAPLNPLVGELKTLVNGTGNPDNDVIIALPVVDGWTGSGDPAEVHAPGVVTVKLCGFSLNPKNAPEKIDPTCWDPALYETVKDSKSKFVFQWTYGEYTTSYTTTGSGTACSLTDADCVPAIRLWRNP